MAEPGSAKKAGSQAASSEPAMTRSACPNLTNGSNRRTREVPVPVSGTALLLIDVINDLAFKGSDVLVAQAEPMALRLAGLKRRATAGGVPAIYVNDNLVSGGPIFGGRSRTAPLARRQVAECRNVYDQCRATILC